MMVGSWSVRSVTAVPITPPDVGCAAVIGGPAFRSLHADHLLQMADVIAHPPLKQEEEPSARIERLGVKQAFGILPRALNRRGSS